tara:strand:+ start:20451 stop:20864 length:414 start_codon:yes stop_codon:yes gene_type:complete
MRGFFNSAFERTTFMIDDFDPVLEQIAASDEAYSSDYDLVEAWETIRSDLRARGPFTRMLLELRATAHTAMKELVYCEASDKGKIASLQNEVRRYTHMMTIISTYKSSADFLEVNNEAESPEYSDDDIDFIATIEQP